MEESINSVKKYYFYYEPSTGKVVSVATLYIEQSYPYIEVLQSELNTDSPIDLREWEVKEGKVIKRELSLADFQKIDNMIYKIPKIFEKDSISEVDHPFDILIEQHNEKKEFRLRLSGQIKDQYSKIDNRLNVVLYVTTKDDPNILYKTIEVSLHKLLNIDLVVDYDDYDGSPCNIYSMRYFKNYLHVVMQ
jgi:hypothetical protein